jgi:hypothetical protein
VCSCIVAISLPIPAAGQASVEICNELLPLMQQSHIPDLALASFANGNMRTYYRSVNSRLLGAKLVSTLLHPRPGSVGALQETNQTDADAKLKLGWGLGIAVEEASGKVYFHWGNNPGFQSFFMVQPASGRGVSFFTDSGNGLDLLDTVVAEFIPGDHPALEFPMLHPKD